MRTEQEIRAKRDIINVLIRNSGDSYTKNYYFNQLSILDWVLE